MLIVGLTGGIGSGKSTVATYFKNKGVAVYIADDASKEILATDSNVQKQVIDLLGKKAYRVNSGILEPDKKYIAAQVFNDKLLLEKLNAILHPAVSVHFAKWLDKQTTAYVIYEAAILLESGSSALCDYIILVTAPLSMRIERVIKRDASNIEQVKSRLNNQWTDKQRLPFAHFVILNEDINKISIQIDRIHDILLK